MQPNHAFVRSWHSPHTEWQSLRYLCLLLALPLHSQTTAEQVRRASWQLPSQTPQGPVARVNLLSSWNKLGPAASPLSPGVLETEPGERKIIKDILCQVSLSRGSPGEPTGEGETGERERRGVRSVKKKKKQEKVMGSKAGVATWREGVKNEEWGCEFPFPLCCPLLLAIPPILCSISKAAGARSSTTDKLGGKAFPFFSFLF